MLVLPATLTSREARDTLRMLGQALRGEAQQPVVVDAAPLQQLDTAALAVLLELERLARASGRSFEVRSAPPRLTALARLYGVDAIVLGGEAGATPSPPATASQRSPAT